MSDMPVLEIENVATIRGRVQVLWDVSLSVRRGETVAIVGPNGAGKTTLVGSITGLVPPKSGRIRINGVDCTGMAPERLATRGVALVPERRGIFAPLTVRENLLMGAYARRARRAELDRDVRDVLDLFPALERYRDAIAGSLSGGEQQMVAIGRALMSNPVLLLMDEPSEGLAPLIVRELERAMSLLKETGLAIVLVEQNLPLALAVADTAYIISKGRVVFHGDPQTIRTDGDVRTKYLGI
ncbi:MAG: ABC transporter ATP-binding protein [Vulcanimicrobiaceae bacterium]